MSHVSQPAQVTIFRHSITAVTQRLASAVPMSDVDQEMIARRACLKWKARAYRSNSALQYWLEAAEEVRAEILGERRS